MYSVKADYGKSACKSITVYVCMYSDNFDL